MKIKFIIIIIIINSQYLLINRSICLIFDNCGNDDDNCDC